MGERRGEGEEVLRGLRYGGREEAREEVEGIVLELLKTRSLPPTGVAAAVRHGPTRRALGIGCGLMALQQLCGINTVMYYAASIYEMSGFSESASIWLSGFTSLAQVVGVRLGVGGQRTEHGRLVGVDVGQRHHRRPAARGAGAAAGGLHGPDATSRRGRRRLGSRHARRRRAPTSDP